MNIIKKNKEKKMPLGLWLIRLLYIFVVPVYVYFIITGVGFLFVKIINSLLWITVGVLVVMVITRRYKWGWYFLVGLSILGVFYEVMHLLFGFYKHGLNFGSSYLLILVLSVVLLIYIFKKRDYFNS